MFSVWQMFGLQPKTNCTKWEKKHTDRLWLFSLLSYLLKNTFMRGCGIKIKALKSIQLLTGQEQLEKMLLFYYLISGSKSHHCFAALLEEHSCLINQEHYHS